MEHEEMTPVEGIRKLLNAMEETADSMRIQSKTLDEHNKTFTAILAGMEQYDKTFTTILAGMKELKERIEKLELKSNLPLN